MSVVDTDIDSRRPSTLRLRLGLDPAFRPRAGHARGDHVLYAGRLSREKGLRELLEASAAAREPWPLVLLARGRRETPCASGRDSWAWPTGSVSSRI